MTLLYLVQHGRSQPKEIDPEQGLSEQGIIEVERVAERAHHLNLHVSEIIHSGKKRARQTAEIFSGWLVHGKEPSVATGLNPTDDVLPVAQTFADRENLMLVGHQPFLDRLTSQLIVNNPDVPVVHFINGGIVCLERWEREMGRKIWSVRWIITPETA
jgi:phosphohistidine phosphatase